MTIESRVEHTKYSSAGEKSQDTNLKGHLGTLDIVLATLAYTAPLAGTVGYITFVVGFGNGLGAPSAFLAVMLAFLLFSVGYGALSRYIPNPGAFYAYITAGLGRAAGLGAAFLVLGAYFCIGVGFYAFAGVAVQELVTGWGGPLLPWWMFSLMFWVTVGSVAYFNVAISTKILGIVLIIEVILAIIFDVVVFSHGGKEGISFQPFTWREFTSGNLGLALIFAGALFAGFEATAIYREETKNPSVTIPRATYLAVLFIGIFYAFTSWAVITGMGISQAVTVSAANPATAFFDIAKEFVGDFYYKVVSILLAGSIFACHLAIHNATTRYVYSLSRDGVLPKALGLAHAKHSSPSRASVTCSIIYFILAAFFVAIGLTSTEMYSWFAGLASFTILIAMAITSLSAFVYFRRNPHHNIGRWEGSIAPLASVASLGGMVFLAAQNFATLIGGSQVIADFMMLGAVIIFIIGYAYALGLKKHKHHIYMKIGRQ